MRNIEANTMKIKERREALGISQIELARALGVSQPCVANWERGLYLPKSQDLPDIAKALRCKHIDDLYPEEVRP